MKYLPWQQRVVDEQRELYYRIESLSEFFKTPAYASLGKKQQNLLEMQYDYMTGYEYTLIRRIELFNGEEK